MTKYSPGPWLAEQATQYNGWWVVYDDNYHEVGSGDGGFYEDEARLIAAAPEMVEALLLVEKYLVERGIERKGIVGRTEVLPAIRQALSKAGVK